MSKMSEHEFLDLVPEIINKSSSSKARFRLFLYLVRYNSKYHFVQLEKAFLLMSKYLIEDIALSKKEIDIVEKEIDFGMHEYFISLNHVSKALFIVFNNQTLTPTMAIEVIDNVWAAFDCNETDYLEREINYLLENL